jgi:hypothetical protein
LFWLVNVPVHPGYTCNFLLRNVFMTLYSLSLRPWTFRPSRDMANNVRAFFQNCFFFTQEGTSHIPRFMYSIFTFKWFYFEFYKYVQYITIGIIPIATLETVDTWIEPGTAALRPVASPSRHKYSNFRDKKFGDVKFGYATSWYVQCENLIKFTKRYFKIF